MKDTVSRRSGVRRVYVAFTAVMVVMTVVALWLVMRASPQRAAPRDAGCVDDGCGAPVSLPEAIRFGPEHSGPNDPVVSVLLWIDLESATSRQIYRQVTRVVATSRREVAAELQLLHLPSGRCDGPGERFACLGARLVECAERSIPGAGVRVAGALFDLQWQRAGGRTADAAALAVTELGLDADPLLACAADSPRTDPVLRSHAALAARHGLASAPGGLVVDRVDPRRMSGFGDWLTESSLRVIVGCLAQRRCQEAA